MPAPRSFTYTTPLPAVRRHLTHTRRELMAHPSLASLAAPYDALLTTWTAVFETDFDLQDQVDAARSAQRSADHDLNAIARRLWKEINLLTGDDPEAPMRKLYFGNKPLHAFIRPILAGQLAATRAWGDSLAKSGHKALETIGQDLAPLLPKADAAVAAEVQAVAKRDEFRTVGARTTFIHDVNAARKKTYSEASTIQQSNAALTSDVIEGLFLRDRSRDEDPTEEGLQEEIEDLEAQLADRKKLLAQLQKQREEAMAQQKQAEAEEKKKRLAQLQKELEDKQKEAAALVAELETP